MLCLQYLLIKEMHNVTYFTQKSIEVDKESQTLGLYITVQVPAASLGKLKQNQNTSFNYRYIPVNKIYLTSKSISTLEINHSLYTS